MRNGRNCFACLSLGDKIFLRAKKIFVFSSRYYSFYFVIGLPSFALEKKKEKNAFLPKMTLMCIAFFLIFAQGSGDALLVPWDLERRVEETR